MACHVRSARRPAPTERRWSPEATACAQSRIPNQPPTTRCALTGPPSLQGCPFPTTGTPQDQALHHTHLLPETGSNGHAEKHVGRRTAATALREKLGKLSSRRCFLGFLGACPDRPQAPSDSVAEQTRCRQPGSFPSPPRLVTKDAPGRPDGPSRKSSDAEQASRLARRSAASVLVFLSRIPRPTEAKLRKFLRSDLAGPRSFLFANPEQIVETLG